MSKSLSPNKYSGGPNGAALEKKNCGLCFSRNLVISLKPYLD